MKVAVAMSGGIDPTVTALLLKNQGHEVTGITLDMLGTARKRLFPDAVDTVSQAALMARELDMPHHSLDIHHDFVRDVIEPFCAEYLLGRTPNPCVRCDALIKFPRLLDLSRELGCQMVASGHYAQCCHENGRYFIKAAYDKTKDQSYFLSMLNQDILPHLLFPLGELTKDEVRSLAEKHDLHCSQRPESQEICFIPDDNYSAFIESWTGTVPRPGTIVDKDGIVLGTHNGIHRYTIGQRRGMGIAADRPLYVTGIDAHANSIIAGYREQLLCRGLRASPITHMKDTDLDNKTALVKTRSMQKHFTAKLEQKGGTVIVRFDTPQMQITPGQVAVFYNSDYEIMGSAIIREGF